MAVHLIVDDAEPFVRITLDRPSSGNVVTPEMMLDLPDAIAAVGPRHKAVVLRGAGPDFCLGREPGPIPGGRTDTAFNAHAAVMGPILAVYRAARQCPVPLIAAVQGRAHGFGCGLVGVCDIALAADDAQFALPEMDKGIPPTLVMCAPGGREPQDARGHGVLVRERVTRRQRFPPASSAASCQPESWMRRSIRCWSHCGDTTPPRSASSRASPASRGTSIPKHFPTSPAIPSRPPSPAHDGAALRPLQRPPATVANPRPSPGLRRRSSSRVPVWEYSFWILNVFASEIPDRDIFLMRSASVQLCSRSGISCCCVSNFHAIFPLGNYHACTNSDTGRDRPHCPEPPANPRGCGSMSSRVRRASACDSSSNWRPANPPPRSARRSRSSRRSAARSTSCRRRNTRAPAANDPCPRCLVGRPDRRSAHAGPAWHTRLRLPPRLASGCGCPRIVRLVAQARRTVFPPRVPPVLRRPAARGEPARRGGASARRFARQRFRPSRSARRRCGGCAPASAARRSATGACSGRTTGAARRGRPGAGAGCAAGAPPARR